MGSSGAATTAAKGNLFQRSAPGGRALIAAIAALVPLSGATLVAIDASETGSVDGVLAAAAAAFVLVSLVVAALALKRLRCLAAITDAVRTSTEPRASRAELTIDPALGRGAEDWNLLVGRMLGLEVPTATSADRTREGDSVVDSLADGVLVIDRSLVVETANPSAAALLASDTGNLAGHSLVEVGPAVLGELAETVLAGGPVQRQPIQFGSEDSPQVLRVRIARLSGSRDRAVVTLTDITRQSVAEASRGGFLARATHELRAPLTNVKLYTEQAIQEGDDDPQLRQEALNVIGREVLRLERTVADLLRVSELESGSLRGTRTEIQIEDMLNEIRESFSAAASAKVIGLTLDAPPKLPMLRGDRDHIELVIQNLVGNAIKYTPEGGTVLIRADASEHEFSLEVIDSGIGIAPEETNLVFDTFYRSDDVRVHDTEGSGLGLSLAREIARQHGGDITLESELNRGSTFTFRMPIEQSQGQASSHGQAQAQRPAA